MNLLHCADMYVPYCDLASVHGSQTASAPVSTMALEFEILAAEAQEC